MISILENMSKNYSKVKPKNLVGSINIEIAENIFNLKLSEDNTSIHEGKDDKAIMTLYMNEETWGNLASGKWNGMTAAGREHMSQSTPLDFKFGKDVVLSKELMQDLYHLAMHFFNTTYPTHAYFGLENTRVIHGGNAVALAYGPGVRSAYYAIRDDQQINADEKDPWTQCFIVIGGSGTATIDGVKMKIEKGMAIHVPPNVTHTFIADSGVILEGIWLAYGEGA
jgi:mannose-6-phosphate isomerase-like protein (cupin superfamily)